jgi:hypothetical protein
VLYCLGALQLLVCIVYMVIMHCVWFTRSNEYIWCMMTLYDVLNLCLIGRVVINVFKFISFKINDIECVYYSVLGLRHSVHSGLTVE